jgi:hypothetical protein
VQIIPSNGFHTEAEAPKRSSCYGSVKMIRFSYSNEDTKDGEKELASTKCCAKRQALTHTNPREETSGVGSVRIQSKLRATSPAIFEQICTHRCGVAI